MFILCIAAAAPQVVQPAVFHELLRTQKGRAWLQQQADHKQNEAIKQNQAIKQLDIKINKYKLCLEEYKKAVLNVATMPAGNERDRAIKGMLELRKELEKYKLELGEHYKNSFNKQ